MREKIVRTMQYEKLVDLFVRSGLEISPEEPAPDGLITCFRMEDADTGELIGASGLCSVNGEYILRCVAVEECFRGRGYGIRLVEEARKEAKALGAERIWLTAKIPAFYKKFGFEAVAKEEAPMKVKCTECPQYHNGCDSEVMVYYY